MVENDNNADDAVAARRSTGNPKRPRPMNPVRRQREHDDRGTGHKARATGTPGKVATRQNEKMPRSDTAAPVGNTPALIPAPRLVNANALDSNPAITNQYRGIDNRYGTPVTKPVRLTHARNGPRPAADPVSKGYSLRTDLNLPYKFGMFTYSEKTVTGIRVLTAARSDVRQFSSKEIDQIVKAITLNNRFIKDPALQVNVCFIGPIGQTSGQFRTLHGASVLTMDPDKGHDPTTANHEMVHAVFHYLRRSETAMVGGVKSIQIVRQIADIFLQLQKIKIREPERTFTADRLVDPSIVEGKSQETGGDADEFFASSFRAFQVVPEKLRKSFQAREPKHKELTALRNRLFAIMSAIKEDTRLGKLPSVDEAEIDSYLENIGKVQNLEDTINEKTTGPQRRIANEPLQILIVPEQRKVIR